MFSFKNKYLNITINIISYIIVILSIYFIIVSFKKNVIFKDIKSLFNYNFLFLLIIESLVYSFVVFLYSISYYNNLKIVIKKKVDFNKVCMIYLKSNIAKYFPGNIFHFAGRHSLVDSKNIFHKDMLFASITEIILLIFSSILLGFPVILKNILYLFNLVCKKMFFMVYLLPVFILIFTGIIIFIFYKKVNLEKIKDFFNMKNYKLFLKSLSIYFLIFILICILLYFIFLFLSNYTFNINILFSVIGLFSVSWVVGYVVPGASGGIGIREALIIYLSAAFFPSDIAILAAFFLRIVTTLGDIIAFIVSFFIKVNNPQHQEI